MATESKNSLNCRKKKDWFKKRPIKFFLAFSEYVFVLIVKNCGYGKWNAYSLITVNRKCFRLRTIWMIMVKKPKTFFRVTWILCLNWWLQHYPPVIFQQNTIDLRLFIFFNHMHMQGGWQDRCCAWILIKQIIIVVLTWNWVWMSLAYTYSSSYIVSQDSSEQRKIDVISAFLTEIILALKELFL